MNILKKINQLIYLIFVNIKGHYAPFYIDAEGLLYIYFEDFFRKDPLIYGYKEDKAGRAHRQGIEEVYSSNYGPSKSQKDGYSCAFFILSLILNHYKNPHLLKRFAIEAKSSRDRKAQLPIELIKLSQNSELVHFHRPIFNTKQLPVMPYDRVVKYCIQLNTKKYLNMASVYKRLDYIRKIGIEKIVFDEAKQSVYNAAENFLNHEHLIELGVGYDGNNVFIDFLNMIDARRGVIFNYETKESERVLGSVYFSLFNKVVEDLDATFVNQDNIQVIRDLIILDKDSDAYKIFNEELNSSDQQKLSQLHNLVRKGINALKCYPRYAVDSASATRAREMTVMERS